MSMAVLLGIILLICAVTVLILGIRKFSKSFEDKLAFSMIACVCATASIAMFGISEFPYERYGRVIECLDDGYSLTLDDHEIASGSIAEHIDKYIILQIDDKERRVFIRSTEDSPFSMKEE